jgi:hypothetical protein
MGWCPTDCGEITILGTPALCQLDPRLKTLSQIGFYACNTSLPDPLDASAIEALIASDAIVFSQMLSNITLNDPTYTELTVADCLPNRRNVANREITFNDRIAVPVDEGSPAVTNLFGDWAFWADKEDKIVSLYTLWKYCDGDVIIVKDKYGNPISADLKVNVNYEAAGAQGGGRPEIKAVSLIYAGDPINVWNPPAFNIANDGTVTIL